VEDERGMDGERVERTTRPRGALYMAPAVIDDPEAEL